MSLTPFIWVIVTFPILLFFERNVHRRLRGLFYLMTGSRRYSLYWYSIILLPGVFLHELSHWLFANLLGVRTGGFSIFPSEEADGSTTLGYVEYYRSPWLDPVREGLIGAAPLFTGVTVIVFISRYLFNTPTLLSLLTSADPIVILRAAWNTTQTADVYLWLYMLFAICNSMMPSSSDRRAWPLMFVTIVTMGIVFYFLDAFPLLINSYGDSVARLFSYVALAFSITILIDMAAIIILLILQKLVERMTGYRIHYR